MMRTFFFFLFLSLGLSLGAQQHEDKISIKEVSKFFDKQSKDTLQTKRDGFEIYGYIEGKYPAKIVYLLAEKGIQGASYVIDSAEVKNNTYYFKGGSQEYPLMCFIKSGDPDCVSPIAPFFLENGVIRIKSDANYFMKNSISGTPMNDLFDFFRTLENNYNDSIRRAFLIDRVLYGEKNYEEENKAFKRRSEESTKKTKDLMLYFATKYKDQPIAPFMLYWGLRSRLSLEELQNFRDQLDESLVSHPYTVQLDEYIRCAGFGIGSDMPELIIPSDKDVMIKISDFRGKYLLIDFWASWCGPCRREMPNVVKLYKDYRGKKFEILGISLDNDRSKWLGAIKSLGLKWPQVSDLKMWDCEAVRLCNISSIPTTILIDPSGKVLAIGLRGEELAQKIKELVNK